MTERRRTAAQRRLIAAAAAAGWTITQISSRGEAFYFHAGVAYWLVTAPRGWKLPASATAAAYLACYSAWDDTFQRAYMTGRSNALESLYSISALGK